MKSNTPNSQEKYPPNPAIHDIQPGDVIYDEAEADAIERCPHDKENPYVIISSELLRNQSLSPECRWLLCYLLSNEKGWRINRRQVANHLKGQCGRDKIDSIFNEAIDAGYMKKQDILIRRDKGGALRRCKYYISETPKFKKCFQHTPFQGPGFQGTENTGDKVVSRKVLSSPSINNPPLSSPPEKSTAIKSPKKISLRSEEEDLAAQKEIKAYEILDTTTLSPKDKIRLTKEYPEEKVIDAVKISKTQTIKKSLMSLLINILNNPDKWQNPPERKSQPFKPEDIIQYNQEKAIEYNEKLKKQKGVARERHLKPGSKTHDTVPLEKVAKENDTMIFESNAMRIVLGGFLTTVSLRSSEFTKDIKDAIAHLR